MSLGAANDEQQLEIEAPSAGHRAPSAPRLAGVVALRAPARPLDRVIDRGVEGWLADIRPGGGCRLGGGGSWVNDGSPLDELGRDDTPLMHSALFLNRNVLLPSAST